MPEKQSLNRGGDMAASQALELEADDAAEQATSGQLDTEQQDPQIRLSKKLMQQSYVAYDALPKDERTIADLLVSSGAIRVLQNRDGFLYLTRQSRFISLLRGTNGKSGILHRLASGRVFTGS